jgi:hypothetical protein
MCTYKRVTINRQIYEKYLIDRNLGQKNEKKVTFEGPLFSRKKSLFLSLFFHHFLHVICPLAIGDADDI